MTDGRSAAVPEPSGRRGRWNGFVAEQPTTGRAGKALHDPDNPKHRVRVESDGHTVFVHLSDEDGRGWTSLALDRTSREWAVAQRDTQGDAAGAAHRLLRGDTGPVSGP